VSTARKPPPTFGHHPRYHTLRVERIRQREDVSSPRPCSSTGLEAHSGPRDATHLDVSSAPDWRTLHHVATSCDALHSQPEVNAHSLSSHGERARVRESEKRSHREKVHREKVSERVPWRNTNRNRERERELQMPLVRAPATTTNMSN
jgi:hypothetical protein